MAIKIKYQGRTGETTRLFESEAAANRFVKSTGVEIAEKAILSPEQYQIAQREAAMQTREMGQTSQLEKQAEAYRLAELDREVMKFKPRVTVFSKEEDFVKAMSKQSLF